jgi:hypothetical protein
VSFPFEVKLRLETRRRIRALQEERGEGPLTENDFRAVLAETDETTASEDALYAAYCAAIGVELVEVSPEEMGRIRRGIAKGEQVEREIAAEREREARAFAERERQEQTEADALWPAYKAALGPYGGYE